VNKSQDDDRLVAATSPLAERIELHGIKVVGSDIDMRPMANGVVIQGGHTTILKPRGYHLLLRGVTASLVEGSTLPITLTFEKAGAVAVEFAVEEPGLIGEAILNEEHHRG
jgi:copper(I)-binding protein